MISRRSAGILGPRGWAGADGGPAAGWSPEEERHLGRFRAAVLAGVQVVVSYEPPGRPAEDRRLHPHGLVCKWGVWYLLTTASTGLRTYRISRVRSVTVTDQPAERPAGFDLAEATALRRLRALVEAWWSLGEGEAADDGSAALTIHFPSAAVAAVELAPLGDRVEVIAPRRCAPSWPRSAADW